MQHDISSTLGFDTLVRDGRNLFYKRMAAAGGKSVMTAILADCETLLNEGLDRKKSLAADMQLARLTGYIRAMAEMVGDLPPLGFKFDLTDDRGTFHLNGRLELPSGKQESSEPKAPSQPDLDKLEGPEYEAALAKLTPAEREKYLVAT